MPLFYIASFSSQRLTAGTGNIEAGVAALNDSTIMIDKNSRGLNLRNTSSIEVLLYKYDGDVDYMPLYPRDSVLIDQVTKDVLVKSLTGNACSYVYDMVIG